MVFGRSPICIPLGIIKSDFNEEGSHGRSLTVQLLVANPTYRGAGAGPAGTAAAGPMLEAKLMNLIKGQLQKF